MQTRPELSDEDLMLAYAAGDMAAFDTLYARHETGMLRFVARLLGRPLQAQVEEVFQEAWLRIVTARASFQPQGARWRTWAFTIAHHASMDCLRRTGRQRQVEVALPDVHADDAQWGQTPEEQAMRLDPAALQQARACSTEECVFWRAAGQRLMHCLEELPEEQRAAFLLRHQEDWSLQELAEHLNLAFEAVRSRLRYGNQKLRHCMRSYLQALEGVA
ncbi:sigma-70 family RNA polymerase sigma factor [Corticibacter populi]|uniref:Sigma-70 family RNA polymerase sigma factor n=1 Tax=Corticibacter populi TaxID=1550736 RepID=A0A3M6QTL9_9BURK|nr:sigma-70 family RNA polymerase sigma factor [Corticibacter populi]RMX06385.1 sigma-70 family RNA polymerase sigma factor [Corticibacter populi]RZS32069.1 RNA polymerase sigma-70 factor (ECF subfamily) [Corticibacter populi]